jgi:S1-C subfamily serine protease
MTPEVAATAGLPQALSAVVTSVERNSAAERAGLKAGDAIVEIDGKVVHSASDVRNRVGLREAGTGVTITYLHEGKRHIVTLVTAEVR